MHLIMDAVIWLQLVPDCSIDFLWHSDTCKEESVITASMFAEVLWKSKHLGCRSSVPRKEATTGTLFPRKSTLKPGWFLLLRMKLGSRIRTTMRLRMGSSQNEFSPWQCSDVVDVSSHDSEWVCFSLSPSPHPAPGSLVDIPINISGVGCITLGGGGQREGDSPAWGFSRNWLIWLLDNSFRMNHWAISFSSSPLGHIKKYEWCWLPFPVLCKNF